MEQSFFIPVSRRDLLKLAGLTFAGAVRRDSICATELLNECFTNSKHNIKVIAEILGCCRRCHCRQKRLKSRYR